MFFKNSSPVSKIMAWLDKRAENFREGIEDNKDVQYVKRQKILERIRQANIVERKEIKCQLGDDLRAFVYKVFKIDKNNGIVFLKNERGTVRKVSINDKIFGELQKSKK